MATGNEIYFPEQSSTAEIYNPDKVYNVGDYFIKQGKLIRVNSAETTDDWQLGSQDLTKARIYTQTFFGAVWDLGFTIMSTSVKFNITLFDGTTEQIIPTSYDSSYGMLFTPKFNIRKNNKNIICLIPTNDVKYGDFIGLTCIDPNGIEHNLLQKKTCTVLCVEGLNAIYMNPPYKKSKVEIDGVVRDDLPDNTSYFGWPVYEGEVDSYPENAVYASSAYLYLLNKPSITSYKTERPVIEYDLKEVDMLNIVETKLEDKDPLVKNTLTIAAEKTHNTISPNAYAVLTVGFYNKVKNNTQYSGVIGYGNELNGNDQFAVGYNNVLEGDYAIALSS